MNPNNDFLSEFNESEIAPKKRRTKEEILKDKYPEYFALTEYQRKCLVATNYWRVMNGMSFIEVPEQDTHFHKYFDNRCFDLYRKKKKQEEKLKQLEANKPVYKLAEPEPIPEPIPEPTPEPDKIKKLKKTNNNNSNNQPTLF